MTLQTTQQREYKDRLFKAIFGRNTDESKRWRLDLYNALNGTNYTDPDALKVNTIENVIYITMHNDISFLIGDQIVLYEQQANHNQNMALRGFLYFSQLYQIYLAENELDPNRSKKIEIPAPQFVVFYNGPDKLDDEFEIRLSDSFASNGCGNQNKGAYEWTAFVKNINENHNRLLQKKCNALYDYSRFVEKVRRNKKSGLNAHDAVNKAVDEAISENLLDGFFVRQKAEVIGMILEEFDEERFKKNMREEGYEDGFADGIQKKAVEAAENFLREGISPEIIARCTGLSLEKVQELAERVCAKA